MKCKYCKGKGKIAVFNKRITYMGITIVGPGIFTCECQWKKK